MPNRTCVWFAIGSIIKQIGTCMVVPGTRARVLSNVCLTMPNFFFLPNWHWFNQKKSLKWGQTLTLIREFLGPLSSAFSGKKSRIIAGNVTIGTQKMKIICADRVSVRLSNGAYFKWHMPICVERCRAEQKYMPFFGTVTERSFRKKIPKHRNIYG